MKTKLHHYSGAAAAFLIVGSPKVEAQVQYHDIEPDLYFEGNADPYYLDVNFDGNWDFKFWHNADMEDIWHGFSLTGCLGLLYPSYDYARVGTVEVSGQTFVVPVNYGEALFPFGWGSLGGAINMQYDNDLSTHALGPWVSPDDKYMGFKLLTVDDSLYNGWIRLQVDVCGYYIKDFAIADFHIPIVAGTGLPDPCEPPADLNVIAVGAETAKISWEAVDGATSYNVRFRKIGDPGWHTKLIAAPKNFAKLKLLNCDSDYEWQVQSNCDGALSDYTLLGNFTTLPCRLGDAHDVDFSIYPNPASNELHINFDESIENATMEIIDLTGKVIYSDQVNGYQATFDLTEMPAGVYFISLKSGDEIQRLQFLKQ